MITTTTTNATTTRSLADIMRTAHALTQRSIEKNPGDSYRATFAAALRTAWRETGRSAAEIWAIYTDAEKYAALQRMTARAYQMRDARTTKDGRPLPNLFSWIDPANIGDDLRAVAHAALERLEDMLDPAAALVRARAALDAARTAAAAAADAAAAAAAAAVNDCSMSRAAAARARNAAASAADDLICAERAAARAERAVDDPRRAEMPMSRLLYAAVLGAAQAIGRAEKRNGSALKTVTGSDGEPLTVIDRLDVLGQRAPDPYAATVTRAAIDAAAADDIDRVIIACLAAGYTRRETAARVGMTHGAVNYRVSKIRDRYSAG